MVSNGVIASKIEFLNATVSQLRTLSDLTTARLEQDYFLKRGVERSLQLCVEAVIDIAHRLVSLLDEPPCTSASAALATLQRRGVIESADHYRRMVQFRNIVVHRYQSVDNAVLVDIVRNRLGDLERFVEEVRHANVGP